MNNDLKRTMQELKIKTKIINTIKKIGIKENQIRHIISAESKQPLLTFRADTKEDFKQLLKVFEPYFLNAYVDRSACVGINPVNEQTEKQHERLNYPVYFQTNITRYNDKDIKFKFYVSINKSIFSVWIDTPLNYFNESLFFLETIKDTYETETARKYNYRHADIMTQRPVFKNLSTIKYYGGYVTHYAKDKDETKTLKGILKSI